ncbi:YebC/PmpR family DNA-binding transcriptional regulator [soil metagenome]
MTVAAREGGGDPGTNPRLRLAIEKAKAASMPKDNVERAIGRGSGEAGTDAYQEIRYEGYGPGGVAVMVECLTDNRNRTVADVRHAFSKHGGNLGADGSVAYLFNQVGQLSYPAGTNEEAVIAAALEAGAEDVVTNSDGSMDVLTDPIELEQVAAAMREAGQETEDGEVTMRAAVAVVLDGVEAAAMVKLAEALDDLDDVQAVYTNADIPDEVLAEL